MKKLINRIINSTFFKEIIGNEAEEGVKEDEKNLQNQYRSYSYGMMVLIFFLSPFIIGRRFTIGKDLFELKAEGYRLKFKQRIGLLIGGLLFWTLLVFEQIGYFD